MKKHGTPHQKPHLDIETLAQQQSVKPNRRPEDMYRHSVRDEDLDEWLRDLEALRHDNLPSRAPRS